MEQQVLRLSSLEAKRDAKRLEIEENFEQRAVLRNQMLELEQQQQALMMQKETLEQDLVKLDDDIATLEHDIIIDESRNQDDDDNNNNSSNNNNNNTVLEGCMEVNDGGPRPAIRQEAMHMGEGFQHQTTTTTTTQQTQDGDILTDPMTLTMPHPDEILTEPTTHQPQHDQEVHQEQDHVHVPTNPFFAPRVTQASTASGSSLPHDSLQQYLLQPSGSSSSTPRTFQIQSLLQNVFQLQSFRTHQEDIINATLDQRDCFVIMRTGGGKSLTYQLPAMLEGLSAQKKITIVVSPLLSLIQDQQDQLNHIYKRRRRHDDSNARHSLNAFDDDPAVSFTSGSGTASEQAQRWNRVRDTNGGVCMILVTPERVSSSAKFETELRKLHQQGRLGRFVIDEAHCATQWGHDFRPDYCALGCLKQWFPMIPLLAVTATASATVRQDVVRILRMQPNYQFYQSSANRPNLKYSVRSKPDTKDAILQDMAEYIHTHHPQQTGIVYTFSRKEAEDVAFGLQARGIAAEPYHASISPAAKNRIHTAWMKGTACKVVVATIAFGLGINKPNVRFVLHHSISKTLEAYYQESGRAGRDGLPSSCVLYYSPKDVTRMLSMISGTSAERCTFWPMVRYGQAHGNDAVCRAILLKKLGEVNAPDPTVILKQEEGSTFESRPVTEHIRTLLQLLQSKAGEKLTMSMIVKEWRTKTPTLECLKENPPNKELSTNECERIIVMLMLEEHLNPRVVTNKYSSCVYIDIGPSVPRMIASNALNVSIPLPIKTVAPKTKPLGVGWTKKTSKPVKKVAAAAKKKQTTKKKKSTTRKSTAKTKHGTEKPAKTSNRQEEVIDLLAESDRVDDDDDDDSLEIQPPKTTQDLLWDDDSEEEFEFDG